jgi:hypothetical protein
MAPSTGQTVLERDRELQQISGALDQASTGIGSLIVVEGAPGIGKTALLAAARSRAAAAEFTTLVGRGGELEQAFPFGVARQLFERTVRRALQDDAATSLLNGPAGLARSLFSGSLDVVDASDGARSQAVLYGLYWLVVNLSEREPVAIVIDDAHWSDVASLRLIDVLTRRIEDLALLIVVTHRPAPADPQRAVIDRLLAGGEATRMSLAPLTESASASVMARELGREPTPGFASATQALTGGNPFLIEELGHEAAAMGIRGNDAEVERIKRLSPASVTDSVMGRLAAVEGTCRSLAEAVAILGDGTPLRLAARLAEMDLETAQREADRLANLHLLRHARPPGFRHPLLRSAVLEGIMPGRRAMLHASAARALGEDGADPSRIAVHLLGTEPAGESSTVATLRMAARDSAAKGSPDTAAAFLRRALEELPRSDPRRPELGLELGNALSAIDPEAAVQVLVDAANNTADAALWATAARAAAHAMCTIGRVREARDFAEQQLERIEYRGESAVRNLARVAAELNVTAADEPERVLIATERYWRWAEEHGEDAPIAAAQRAYIFAASGRDRAHARDLARRAAESHQPWEKLGPDEYSFAALIVALLATDDLAEARAQSTLGIERARADGHLTAVANCSMWRSLIALTAGDLVSAETDARTALAIAGDTAQLIGVPIATATLASSLIDQGQLPMATEILESPSL